MKSKYITKKVSESTSKVLRKILKKNCVDNIFDFELWIAGGFPRILGKIDEQNLDPIKTIYNYFMSLDGDIDIFGKHINDINNLVKENSQKYDWNYRSPFAINCNSQTSEIKSTNIQFVTEFLYKSYDSCLDNFDFTNCKYVLFLENNEFYIRKDKRAEAFNNKMMLNIDKCVSPLLGQRIVKYCKKHGFKGLSRTEETKNSFNNYLYKILTSDWDSIYNRIGNIEEISDYYIKRLHQQTPLTSEELSLFVGKFNTILTEKIYHSYGFYIKEKGVTDWASNEIRKK